MTLANIIATYGCPAIFVGTLVEGEASLLLGAFAAHQGYLGIASALLAALGGSITGDTFFFCLGRFQGTKFLARRPDWRQRIDKVLNLMQRHDILIITGYRFLYGMRCVTPFMIGLHHTKATRFLLFATIGNVLWVVTIGMTGYFATSAIELLLGNVKRYEATVLAVGAVLVLALLIIRRLRRQRLERSASTPPHSNGTA